MVYDNSLENCRRESVRGFESHLVLHTGIAELTEAKVLKTLDENISGGSNPPTRTNNADVV